MLSRSKLVLVVGAVVIGLQLLGRGIQTTNSSSISIMPVAEPSFSDHITIEKEATASVVTHENELTPTDRVEQMLGPDVVPNVVHYIWCTKEVLQFHHYLSMRSAIHFIKPNRIVFHYRHYPRSDKYWYNTWLEDIKEEYPFFVIHQLTGDDISACDSKDKELSWIGLLLNSHGGIYLHHNTIITRYPAYLRNTSASALTDNVFGFLTAKPGFLSNGLPRHLITCVTKEEFKYNSEDHICVRKKSVYYPKNAWEKDDDFSKLVNTLMYGQTHVPRLAPDPRTLIPNIGHMFWSGKKSITFLFYLSVLSQIHILKLDTVYVHGDTEPRGQYWSKLKHHCGARLVYNHRVLPDIIYRNRVADVHHIADVFRIDALLRFGGIYTDADAVWVNRFPEWLREYDAVATYDWPLLYKSYPDYVQNGVMMGKPGASYWKLVRDSMSVFKDDIFGYNGLLRPYKVLEKHPDTLYLYDKLQVMCWYLKCHPTWDPDFRAANSSHLTMKDFNWREGHVYHWTYPTPKELNNCDAVRDGQGIFAEIGRRVLEAAGLLHSNNTCE